MLHRRGLPSSCDLEVYQGVASDSLTKPANRATLLVGVRARVRNIDAVENV